jgi:aspartate aminotransferase
MWTEIAENIRLGGGVPVPVQLAEQQGYQYDIPAIEAAITPKTRAIFVNTPHNPTGAVASREILQGIASLAEKYKLYLVSDEAYEHVIFDSWQHVSLGSLPGAQERTLTAFSMSKSYAMSGLRVGYLVVPDGHLLLRLKKLVRCTINGVNSATQYGAAAALDGPQDETHRMARVYQERRDILFEALKGAPYIKPFKPSGTFYLWTRILPDWPGYKDKQDDWSKVNYLVDPAGISSSPGSAFGEAGVDHIRFAFSCSTEQVTEAAGLLTELLNQAGK